MVEPRMSFGNGVEAGVAYLERWANLHQERILEIVRGYEAKNAYEVAESANTPKAEIPLTTHHRRRKRR
jgi:hypothetical protein